MFGKNQPFRWSSHWFALLLGSGVAVTAGSFWVGSCWLNSSPALAYDPDQLLQLLRTRRCPGCDLSYADLAGRNLEGADLTGANLNAANLRRAKLERANLTGANLNSADLSRSNLSGADLSGATLVLTRLESTLLMNTNLQNSILGGRDRLSGAASLQGSTLPTGRPAVWR